jgi:hypothetical protein
MKNKISLMIALLVASFASNAQLYLGGKVGLNLANVSASGAAVTNVAFNKKIGINGGATLKYNFTNTLGAQMDLLYSQMGSNSKQVTETDDGAGGKITMIEETLYDLSYLQIPLFVNFEIPIRTENLIPYRISESVVSAHLYGGGYFGYALGHTATYSAKTTTVDVDNNTTIVLTPKAAIKEDSKHAFNAMDFGLAIGAGFSFKLSDKGRFTIDGRYLMGMGDFNSNGTYYLVGKVKPSMKNKAPQIQLGYIHRISRLRRWQIQ